MKLDEARREVARRKRLLRDDPDTDTTALAAAASTRAIASHPFAVATAGVTLIAIARHAKLRRLAVAAIPIVARAAAAKLTAKAVS